MNSSEFIKNYLNKTAEISSKVNNDDIDKFINILFDAWKNSKKVFSAGNGGSSSTASHFCGDLLKTVANSSSEKDIDATRKGFKAICLNDNSAGLTAWINDSGWDNAYSGLLNSLFEEGDVLILISVHGGSGWSNNMVKAMETVKKRKGKILGLSGFDGGKLKELADACVVVPIDSTPHVEGFHVVLQHLIVDRVRELIQEDFKKSTSAIKFFADTASLPEISYCFERGVNDGITTNPKIIETTGDLTMGFTKACKTILDKYPQVPVSLETDLNGDTTNLGLRINEVKDVLLSQADKLCSLKDNVVVKIPICEAGLVATKVLSSKGIKTNVTACMTPYQALAAAEAGATYVSLFANRMLDSHIIELSGNSLNILTQKTDWKDIVKANKDKYFEKAWEKTLEQISYVAKNLENKSTKLIVGSIRTPEDISRLVRAKPQIITIPFKIVTELKDIESLKNTERTINSDDIVIGNSLYHPMTQITLEEFEKAADTYRKNK